MFYDFGTHNLYNVSRVRLVRFRPVNNETGVPRTEVTLIYDDDTTQSIITCEDKENVQECLAVVVPAAPGFSQLEYWFDDDKPTVAEVMKTTQRTPIVAWRTVYNMWAEPITAGHWTLASNGFGGMLCPDGRVIVEERMNCATLEEWAKAAVDEWHEWRKKQVPRKVSTK